MGNHGKGRGLLTPAEELLGGHRHAGHDRVMRVMTEHRLRHVPVRVNNHLAGLVSIGDMVAARIGELEQEREQLATYITHG